MIIKSPSTQNVICIRNLISQFIIMFRCSAVSITPRWWIMTWIILMSDTVHEDSDDDDTVIILQCTERTQAKHGSGVNYHNWYVEMWPATMLMVLAMATSSSEVQFTKSSFAVIRSSCSCWTTTHHCQYTESILKTLSWILSIAIVVKRFSKHNS
jgi:hypothetical protein